LRNAAASALVFFGALVLGAVISHFVVVAVRDSRFSPADRTLGGGLGLIRAAIVISLFVLISGQMGASDKRWWRDSQLIAAFSPLARGFESIIPQRWLALLKPTVDPITPPSSPSGQ
ncbi:MAG TPA: CvpA family protein, partial [Fontimonas sp.]